MLIEIICSRRDKCLSPDGPLQPEENFKTNGGHTYKMCQSCRLGERDKKSKNPYKRSGYGSVPKRHFQLAPHHLLASRDPAFNCQHIGPLRLQLLRSPEGCPVVRLHGDLGPDEVSWVLG